MPTSDEYVNLALKRFLSQNRMENEFRAWLEGLITDGLARIFPSSGLFTFPVTLGLATPNEIDLSPDPVEGIDNAGHVLILEGTARTQDIAYEDDGINVYWVGMKYNVIPSGVYNNPRTGVPEYDKWKEEVGEVDFPTSVADGGGGTIVINVNSIFESGVDHSGREVLVWLVNPVSGDPAVAFETATVAYAAPNNTITTTGSLGQGAISTVAANYKVAALGATVRKNPTNPFGSEYIVLASIDSSGPSYDNSMQLDLSGGTNTLQAAYDASGAGAGRTVVADDQAIQVRQQQSSLYEHDIAYAALRLRKDIDTALPTFGNPEDVENGLDLAMRFFSHSGLLHRVQLADFTGGDKLRVEEDCDITAPAVITLTRGGSLDLLLTGNVGQIYSSFGLDYVEISGSSLGQDGLYGVNGLTASTVTLRNLGTASNPVLTNESGLKCRFFRPLIRTGVEGTGVHISAVNDFYEDETGSPMGTQAVLGIRVPENTDDDDEILSIVRIVGGERFRVFADGDAHMDGKFDVDGGIEVVSGNIEITAGGGKVSGPTVESTVGDITSADDVVATTDFEYASAVLKWLWLLPEDALFDTGTSSLDPGWQLSPGGYPGAGGSEYGSIISFAADKLALFPIHIPDGVTLDRIEILADRGGATNLNCYIVRTQHTWAASPTLNNRLQIGATMSTVAAGVERLSQDLSVVANNVIDNELYQYSLMIRSRNANDQIYGARIRYSMTIVEPTG